MTPVAVTYYNFQNYTGGPTSWTDYWAVVSTDRGQTRVEDQIDERFLQRSIRSDASGAMIGDYEAFAVSGNTFVAAFEVTNASSSNPTDIELARFTP